MELEARTNKDSDDFHKKNLNSVDYEIKQRELAGQQFATQIKSRMELEAQAAAQAEKAQKKAIAENRTKATELSHYNDLFKQSSDYYNRYSDAISKNPELNSKWQTLLSEMSRGGYAGTPQARQAMTDLMRETNAAGAEVITLRQELENLFGKHLSTALVMAGIHAIQTSLRQIWTNVKDIDSAMTELKKVTNETDAVYKNFLDGATVRAQKLGATISDVVTASADFARLGYNIDDAATLADAAIVYKNVGDGITDINESSESIISTMKAFNIEAKDAISIVDKYNEVGEKYCPAA